MDFVIIQPECLNTVILFLKQKEILNVDYFNKNK